MNTTSNSSGDPSIFISYRRDDSAGHAGRLADRLGQRVGADRVFRDIEDIAAGEDFVARLERQVDECQVLLALIGPRWLAPGASGKPRLFDDGDWVRREIVRAMERGLRVIPVLLQGASMPGADALPPDLARLARLNAMELRESQFERDADYLVSVVAPRSGSARTRRKIAMAASLLLLAGAAAYGAFWTWQQTTPDGAIYQIEHQGLVFDDESFVQHAAQGDLEAVRLFVQAEQDVEAVDDEGQTALQRAVSEGQVDVVQYLLDEEAVPDAALPIATRDASQAIFDLLMASAPGKSAATAALPSAAAMGDAYRMERLVAAGANVNADNRAALRNAAKYSQASALRWLIARGGRVDGPIDPDGSTLLLNAAGASIDDDAQAEERVAQTVGALLDAKADPDAMRGPGSGFLSTPLLTAAYYGRVEVARALLDHGAKIDLASSEGSVSTPLIVAVQRGQLPMVAFLLDRDADVEAADTKGQTALVIAANYGKSEILDLLIAHGADVDHQDKQTLTALMLAAARYDEKIVQRLLEADADVNRSTADGSTALMLLASAGVLPDTPLARRAAATAQLLIAHGAKPDLRNRQGQSARIIAREFAASHEMLAVVDTRP